MKTNRLTWVLAAVMCFVGWASADAQNTQAEVPGDNFSLEGALELFKKSSSPEEFEKLLNSEDSRVNNLDLNGDGYIDYIRVFDRQDGNVHAFIMQAVISEHESQDVAVIELEKLANGKAVLQIVGDEDIYGVETIIEPTHEVRTYGGAMASTTYVNVWAWPAVSYVYGPYYAGWVSPWGWYTRPWWWHRWYPVAYYDYYPYWRTYYPYYSVCHTRRIVYAYPLYRPYRTTSVIVHSRYHERIVHYRSNYNNGRGRDDRGRTAYNHGGAPNGRQQMNGNGRSSGGRQREATPSRSNSYGSRELSSRSNTQHNGPVDRSKSNMGSTPHYAQPNKVDRSNGRQQGTPQWSATSQTNRSSLMKSTQPSRSVDRGVQRGGQSSPSFSHQGYQKASSPARTQASRPSQSMHQGSSSPSMNRSAAPSRSSGNQRSGSSGASRGSSSNSRGRH